jgi:hypothetical protein
MAKKEQPLSDPVAHARARSDAELQDVRRVFGEDSRDWIVARRELARRDRERNPLPRWWPILKWAYVAALGAAGAALFFW